MWNKFIYFNRLFFLCPSMSQRRRLVARSFPDDWRERLYPQQLRGTIRLHPSRRVHNPPLASLLNITLLFKAHTLQCFFLFVFLSLSTVHLHVGRGFPVCTPVKSHFPAIEAFAAVCWWRSVAGPALILCGPLWQVVFWEDHSAWLWEAPFEPAEQTRNIPGEGERDH